MIRRKLLTGLAATALAGAATAQTPGPPVGADATLLGSVPEKASPDVLRLSLDAAIERGLQYNLAAQLRQDQVASEEGSRIKALADLLPNLDAQLSLVRQKINLAAYGLTLPGVPALVGPFNVVDGRFYLRQSVLDLKAIHTSHAAAERLEAARLSYRDTRDLVVLVCGNLYLQAVAGQSRIEAARSELETARSLHTLAADRKAAGLAPAIDELRAGVQMHAREQQLILATNSFAKEKLALSRAIGLGLGQEFELTDPMPFAALPKLTPDEALVQAYAARADWQAAQAALRARQQDRQAAAGEAWPSVGVAADYGALGNDVAGARATFSVSAAVRVPLFEGRRIQGKLREADAALDAEKARVEDLRGRIDEEVRTALLDVQAADERVGVAQQAVTLASEELRQARDRFGAGVANNIEVVQAQQELAISTESYIVSLYESSAAKAALARALGGAEHSYRHFVKGQ